VIRPEMARALLKNASSNGWIVQKFGGTSVGKFPDKIAEDIVRYGSLFYDLTRGRKRLSGLTEVRQVIRREQPTSSRVFGSEHGQEGHGHHEQVGTA
jgi:hypothetical protein